MREIKNKMLLMKLVSYGLLVDKMNINSIVFLIQEEGRISKQDVFNYQFKRKHLYPNSEEMERDIEQLINEEYIVEEGVKYKITEKAKTFLKNTEKKYFQKEVDTYMKYHLYVNKDLNLISLSDKINRDFSVLSAKENGIITYVQDSNSTVNLESVNLKEREKRIKLTQRAVIENDEILMERLKNFNKKTEQMNEEASIK